VADFNDGVFFDVAIGLEDIALEVPDFARKEFFQ
jgi:hypothetical protein